MGDVGDYWRDAKYDRKEESQKKRSRNRESSKRILEERGVQFEVKNMGAHLILKTSIGTIDFWPGTGKFITHSGRRGRGVFNMLKLFEHKEKP